MASGEEVGGVSPALCPTPGGALSASREGTHPLVGADRALRQPCLDGETEAQRGRGWPGSRVRSGALRVDLQACSPCRMSGPGLPLGGDTGMGGFHPQVPERWSAEVTVLQAGPCGDSGPRGGPRGICKDNEAGPASVPPDQAQLLHPALGLPASHGLPLLQLCQPAPSTCHVEAGDSGGRCHESQIWSLFLGCSWLPGG